MLDILTHWFSRFLRRRRRLRNFGRRALPGLLAARGPAPAVPDRLAPDLLLAAREEPAAAIARLQSHANGLSAAEAAERLLQSGPNEVEHEQPLPWWLHLWHCYANPFNLLLTALAVLSFLTEDAQATIVIGAMVILSTMIRFVQEGRSHRAAESLRSMVGNKATVLRRAPDAAAGIDAPATQLEVPRHDVVPGDLVALSAGDIMPADCRLLTARDLFVAQAAMTGESLPVEKFVEGDRTDAGPLEQRNLVFMGTSVVSGAATALVLATGSHTYFGALAARVTATDTAPNAFQAGVNSVSWLLIRFAAVMVPIVLLINGIDKGDWLQAFLFALAVAVGLTPEMLPMIVTTTPSSSMSSFRPS